MFLISSVVLTDSSFTINGLMILNNRSSNSNLGSSGIPYLSWDPAGVSICQATNLQYEAEICSDGQGGAIIVWRDQRTDPDGDIYAQKINSTGNIQWTGSGVPVHITTEAEDNPQLCSDGNGGAIITWDHDGISSGEDIYAQRINSTGDFPWGGVKMISTQTNDQYYPELCMDGDGGAIITWEHYRTIPLYDIYAQKINSSGGFPWGSEKQVCTASNNQILPKICSDGAGGAIIVWWDYRSDADGDIYVQKINSSGQTEWTNNGTIIHATIWEETAAQICSDGLGGAIIVWQHDGVSTGLDIYAQRINSNGGIEWTAGGVEICTNNSDQQNAQICSDGSGGAIITWDDQTSGYDIYAQRINSKGAVEWKTNGVPICVAASDQYFPEIVSDGVGGAIIVWQDYRTGSTSDIYAQRIDSKGNIQWNYNGMLIIGANDLQQYPRLCSDGNEGAIITWQDDRAETSADNIYAQRIEDIPLSSEHEPILIPIISGPNVFDSILSLVGIGIIAAIAASSVVITIIIMKKAK